MNPAEPSGAPALPWPLVAIDFEASSLDEDGYPIEVGLALWPGPDHAVLGWSTLIQPAGAWSRLGHWSPKSAEVHGIAGRDLLAQGQPVARVAAALNEVIGAGTVAWCDGGAYDSHWAGALFKAAGIAPRFVLGDWHRLMAMLGPAMRERGLRWLETAPVRHRAREDAEQLLLALAYAVGTEAGPVRDLSGRWPALAGLTTPGRAVPPNGVAP